MRYSPNTPAPISPDHGHALQYEYQPPIIAYPVAPLEASIPPMPNYDPTVGMLHVGTSEYDQAVNQLAPHVDAIFGDDYLLTPADIAPDAPLAPVFAMATTPNVYNSANSNQPDTASGPATGGWASPSSASMPSAAPVTTGNGGGSRNGSGSGNGRGGSSGGGGGNQGPEGANGPDDDEPFQVPDSLQTPAERAEYVDQLQKAVDYAHDQSWVSHDGIIAHLGVSAERATELLESLQQAGHVNRPSRPDVQLLQSNLAIEDPALVAELKRQLDDMSARHSRAAAVATYRADARVASQTSSGHPGTASAPAAPAATPVATVPAAPVTPPAPTHPPVPAATPNTAPQTGDSHLDETTLYGPNSDFSLIGNRAAYADRGLPVPSGEEGETQLFTDDNGNIIAVPVGDAAALAAVRYHQARIIGQENGAPIAEDPALEAAYAALIHQDQTPPPTRRQRFMQSVLGTASRAHRYLVDPDPNATGQTEPAQAPAQPPTPPAPATAPIAPTSVNTANAPRRPENQPATDARVSAIAGLFDPTKLGRPEDATTLDAAQRFAESRTAAIGETVDLINMLTAQHNWTVDRLAHEILDQDGNVVDPHHPDAVAIIEAQKLQDVINRQCAAATRAYVGEDLSDPDVLNRIVALHNDPNQTALLDEWQYGHGSHGVSDDAAILKAFESEGIFIKPLDRGYGFKLVDANGNPLEGRNGEELEGPGSSDLVGLMWSVARAKRELGPAPQRTAPNSPEEIRSVIDAEIAGLTDLGVTCEREGDDFVFHFGPNGRRVARASVDNWQGVALQLDHLRSLNNLAAQNPDAFTTLATGFQVVAPAQPQPAAAPAGHNTPPQTTAPAPQAPSTPPAAPSAANTNTGPNVREKPSELPQDLYDVYDQNPSIDFYTREQALTALRRMKVSAAAYRDAVSTIGVGSGVFVDQHGNYAVYDEHMLYSGNARAHIQSLQDRIAYMGAVPTSRVYDGDIEDSLGRLPVQSRRNGKFLHDALNDAAEGNSPHFEEFRDKMYSYSIRERHPRTPMDRRTKRLLLGSVAGAAVVATAVAAAMFAVSGAERDEARPEPTASASANPGSKAPSPATSAPQSPEASQSPSQDAKPSQSPSQAKPSPTKTGETSKPAPSVPSEEDTAPKFPGAPDHSQPGAANDNFTLVRNGPIGVGYNAASHEAIGVIGNGGSTWKLAETILKAAKVDASPAAIQHLTSDILAKGGVDWSDAPRVIDPGSTAKVTIDKDGAHVVSVDLK